MRSSLRFSVIIPTLCLSCVSNANADWHLLRADLTMSEIRSPRIERGMVHYLDQTGFETSTPLDQVFFVLPSERGPQWEYTFAGSGTPALIHLTDDQRLQAQIQDNENPDLLQFITEFDSEPRTIPLDQLRLLKMTTDTQSPIDNNGNDTIRLLNNDTLTGFIESIGESVSIDSDGVIRTFQLNQASFVELATDATIIPGTYLYLDADHRMRSHSITASTSSVGTAQSLIFQSDTNAPTRSIQIEFEPQRFAGIEMELESASMIPLAALKPKTITPTGDRSWTQPPSTLIEQIPNSGLNDLDLKAPIQLRYQFESPVSRFACIAELIADRWSDCELIISAGSDSTPIVEIETHRLNTMRDQVEISIDLPQNTSELIISVEPGINGPIQDRVILRKPRLLIKQPLPQFE